MNIIITSSNTPVACITFLLDSTIALWNTEYMERPTQPTNPQPITPPQTPSAHKNLVPLIVIAVVAALLASLGTYFVMSSNQNKESQMSNQQPQQSNPTQSYEPTKQQLTASPTATQTQPESGDTITLDFATCQVGRRRIDVAFGSTTYDVKGRTGSTCEMDYGGEVENPNWDGKLSTTCKIPTNLGVMSFKKSGYGVDFSPIQQYCSQK